MGGIVGGPRRRCPALTCGSDNPPSVLRHLAGPIKGGISLYAIGVKVIRICWSIPRRSKPERLVAISYLCAPGMSIGYPMECHAPRTVVSKSVNYQFQILRIAARHPIGKGCDILSTILTRGRTWVPQNRPGDRVRLVQIDRKPPNILSSTTLVWRNEVNASDWWVSLNLKTQSCYENGCV